MNKYYLMGLDSNDIWRCPDFYVREDDSILITAKDYISEATTFNETEAIKMREQLRKDYGDYTWYLVKTNNEDYDNTI